jgi:hypothetical protein
VVTVERGKERAMIFEGGITITDDSGAAVNVRRQQREDGAAIIVTIERKEGETEVLTFLGTNIFLLLNAVERVIKGS